jgi:hypothetical protein
MIDAYEKKDPSTHPHKGVGLHHKAFWPTETSLPTGKGREQPSLSTEKSPIHSRIAKVGLIVEIQSTAG